MENYLHELTMKYLGKPHTYDSLIDLMLINAFQIVLCTMLLVTALALTLFVNYAIRNDIKVSWFTGVALGTITLVIAALYGEAFVLACIHGAVFR